ncbi:hypothetical protein SLEP1_g37890 [Rubroshorea leprosula]|uniref:DUF4220 domain-containing protein n=1 Tax=Rubroshorea leprosula TaxID=152421 RepID=A0AAV5KW58_9ROSI|nr:hypothetical protein SLEP1_g37890 [Rubroshorea leprosula]
MNESKFHFSRVDICITSILLGGAISLELFAAWVMFSSDWAILTAALHNNMLVRKMFCVVLKCFPCFMNQRKRWSDHMGQFDLLKYCWHHKKKDANKSSVLLQKNISCSDLIEMWHKYMYTKFVKVPSGLKNMGEVFPLHSLLSYSLDGNTIQKLRGQRALQARRQYDTLKWSVESDFDYSIIVWHLATSVCYHHDDCRGPKGIMKIGKRVSNYMMYLLAMRPAMLLPEDGKSFWLDHTYDMLKELFFDATDTKAAGELLLKLDDDDQEANRKSRRYSTLDSLLKDVRKLTTSLNELNELEDKWKMIKEVWLEMLLYAAFSSSNTSHVKQLGEGGEFLSLLWLLGGMMVGIVAMGSDPADHSSSQLEIVEIQSEIIQID